MFLEDEILEINNYNKFTQVNKVKTTYGSFDSRVAACLAIIFQFMHEIGEQAILALINLRADSPVYTRHAAL